MYLQKSKYLPGMVAILLIVYSFLGVPKEQGFVQIVDVRIAVDNYGKYPRLEIN